MKYVGIIAAFVLLAIVAMAVSFIVNRPKDAARLKEDFIADWREKTGVMSLDQLLSVPDGSYLRISNAFQYLSLSEVLDQRAVAMDSQNSSQDEQVINYHFALLAAETILKRQYGHVTVVETMQGGQLTGHQIEVGESVILFTKRYFDYIEHVSNDEIFADIENFANDLARTARPSPSR